MKPLEKNDFIEMLEYTSISVNIRMKLALLFHADLERILSRFGSWADETGID